MTNGWQTLTLDDLCEIARGGSPRPIKKYVTDDPNGINWVRITDATASTKYIFKTAQRITKDGIHRSRMVYDGDFILSNSMSFGRPYIMRTEGCIHDGWLLLRNKSKLFTQDYLYYFLDSPAAYDQFERLAVGSTVKNLKIDSVRKVHVPIPPLADQRRIVGILDEAFAAIAVAKANTEKNLQNARAVFESYLNAVFTQRGDGWETLPLMSLCAYFMDSAHRTPKYQDEGFPALRPRDVVNGMLDLEGTRRVSEEEYEIQSKRHKPRPGDIVYSRELSYGWAAMLPESPRVCLSQGMCLFHPNGNLDGQYVLYVLNGRLGREQAQRAAVGTAHPHINLSAIKSYQIPTPPLKVQKQIIRDCDAIFEATECLESNYERKLAALDELKKSLLHQAFSGKLTAKDTDRTSSEAGV